MTQDEAALWIGKRVMIRPGAPKEIVGSCGKVVATQWHYMGGWVLVVILEKRPEIELLLSESQVIEEASRIPGIGVAQMCPKCRHYWDPNGSKDVLCPGCRS
jgi:hypothetical protein